MIQNNSSKNEKKMSTSQSMFDFKKKSFYCVIFSCEFEYTKYK